LSDPKRRGRTVVAVLAVYWAVWTLYAVVAKASQDFHFDMGRDGRLVARNHVRNPQASAIAGVAGRAWFSIFPLTTWAYDLFAVGIATVSLWVASFGSDALSRRREKRGRARLLTLFRSSTFTLLNSTPTPP